MKKLSLAVAFLLLSASVFAGAWGEGSFENDDALDWVGQCVQSSGETPVVIALEAALRSEMVDAVDGAVAVAAAEVVAASLGKPSAKLPDILRTWLEHQPKAQIAKLRPLARKAIALISSEKTSELKQLWSRDGADKWASQISELDARLK
jgi:hypothetical protein